MNPINFVFIYNYVYHKKVDLNSSEKRDLCLMKLYSKTLQILTYCWNKKSQINNIYNCYNNRKVMGSHSKNMAKFELSC